MTTFADQSDTRAEQLRSREQLRRQAEVPFVFTPEQTRLSLEAAETGLWFLYPETDVLLYSAQMKRLFDQPEDTAVFTYQTFLDLLLPDERDEIDRLNRDAIAELREYELEYRIRWKDGSLHWIHARGRAFFDHDQNCVVYVGTAQEITDRKALEQDLKEAHRIAGLGHWAWDLTTRTMTWSEQSFRNWRMSPSETLLRIDQILLRETPASRTRHQATLDKILADGKPYEIDIEICFPDGTTGWLASRGEVCGWVDGKPAQFRGTIQDISERKRIEIALQESDQRTRLGVKVASLALAEIDYQTGINTLSPEAARMFGLGDAGIALPRSVVHETFHPADRELLERHIAACLNPQGSGWFEVDHRIVWPSGEVRWLRVRKQVYFEGEGSTARAHRAILAAFDVTTAKTIEAALLRSEKLASVGRLSSTIAHEINNPLETIGQSIYLALTDPGITEEGKRYLELATQELERAALITRQTLAFSREASSATRIDLRKKVQDVLRLFTPRFHARGIRVVTRYRPVPPVLAFAGELRQVFANLLSNAMDATTAKGRILIRVASSRADDGSEKVRVTVADTGTGISAEHMANIFEAFFTTKEIVGTGLGLWVSRQILDKHGASIRVRSKPGKGTVFVVAFPAVR
jgi:PAS domain S-box-containing protein